MKIAVADDNQEVLVLMHRLLSDLDPWHQVLLYGELGQLEQAVSSGKQTFDLLFLDIRFGNGQTGSSLVSRLGQSLPGLQIVYITGYARDYALDSLISSESVIGFMIKPLDPSLVKKYVEKAAGRLQQRTFITFTVNGKKMTLDTGQILCIESHNHKAVCKTAGGSGTIYEKLSDLKKRLPPTFVSCHKSYLVNLDQVIRFAGDRIVLSDGSEVPVSRRRKKQIEEQFFHRLGNLTG